MPFVGLVAIGLLVMAGRLFLVDGLQPSQGIASPLRELDIALERAERFAVSESHGVEVLVVPDTNADVAEEPPAPPAISEAAAPAVSEGTPGAASPFDGLLAVTVTPAEPEPKPDPVAAAAPAKPKTVTARSTSNATVKADKSKAAASSTQKSAPKVAPTQASGPWRVQVGAYGSKQAANEIVSKLAKSGYKATVFSGPKFHKVWVQAGSSRSSAEAAASRLKRLGYGGSYVVPPAK